MQVPGGAAGSTLTNTVTGSATQVDDTPANNTATATTPVVASTDLGVTKTGPSRVTAGGAVAWTIVATNAGPSTATGVTVTDPIPAGATVTSATPTQGTCTVTATTVTCALGTLASGASAQIGSPARRGVGDRQPGQHRHHRRGRHHAGNTVDHAARCSARPRRTSVNLAAGLRPPRRPGTSLPDLRHQHRTIGHQGQVRDTAQPPVVRLGDGAMVRGRTACWTIARSAPSTRGSTVARGTGRPPGTTVNVAVVRAGNAARKTTGVALRIRPGVLHVAAFTG